MSIQLDTERLCREELAPLADCIDREGLYPKKFVDALFDLGALSLLDEDFSSLAAQHETLTHVGRYCGTTAFSLWCHSAALWYVLQSENQTLRERYLAPIRSGELRAATGLSNTMKSLSGVENHRLRATPNGNGYTINGDLPWVSHVDDGHIVTVTAQLDDGRLVMFLAKVDGKYVRRENCPPFIALEGSLTYKLVFDALDLRPEQILATPDEMNDYLPRISTGMITLQLGMADGIIRHALALLEENEHYSAGLNANLPEQYAYRTLRQRHQKWSQQLQTLYACDNPDMQKILQVRFDAAQLSLDSSQSVSIHSGGRGFIQGQDAGRLLREATFVAVVTPTMKHLAAALNKLRAGDGLAA